MGSNSIRNGKGKAAYKRKRSQLARRLERAGTFVCHICGGAIDAALPATHAMSFTADHMTPLSRGGDLVKNELRAAHRSCNARRGDHVDVEVWEAS